MERLCWSQVRLLSRIRLLPNEADRLRAAGVLEAHRVVAGVCNVVAVEVEVQVVLQDEGVVGVEAAGSTLECGGQVVVHRGGCVVAPDVVVVAERVVEAVAAGDVHEHAVAHVRVAGHVRADGAQCSCGGNALDDRRRSAVRVVGLGAGPVLLEVDSIDHGLLDPCRADRQSTSVLLDADGGRRDGFAVTAERVVRVE